MYYGPAMSDRPIFFDESRLRWKLLRPVFIAGAIALLTIPIILTLSILNVEVLPELKPQAMALNGPERTPSTNTMLPDPGKRSDRAQLVSFSERWFGGQSETSFSGRWLKSHVVTSQTPTKSSEYIWPKSSEHAATMVTSFTE